MCYGSHEHAWEASTERDESTCREVAGQTAVKRLRESGASARTCLARRKECVTGWWACLSEAGGELGNARAILWIANTLLEQG